jgi:hypothetical protein
MKYPNYPKLPRTIEDEKYSTLSSGRGPGTQMYKDEKELSQKEKEEILKYLKEGGRNLDIFMYSLDANTRPPEKVIEVSLSFAARNGATQQEITDWEKKILKLPMKSTAIDETAK